MGEAGLLRAKAPDGPLDGPEAVLARVDPLLGRVGLRALLCPWERGCCGATAASCRRTVREPSERVAAHRNAASKRTVSPGSLRSVRR